MFHLHCGYENPNIDRSVRLIAYFDAFLGIPSILIDHDVERRTLYGKAGCFRLCPYGCEYRTLSSYFMKDNAHIKWVYKQAIRAIESYNDCKSIPDGSVIQETINSNNEEMAKKLCVAYHLCEDFLE